MDRVLLSCSLLLAVVLSCGESADKASAPSPSPSSLPEESKKAAPLTLQLRITASKSFDIFNRSGEEALCGPFRLWKAPGASTESLAAIQSNGRNTCVDQSGFVSCPEPAGVESQVETDYQVKEPVLGTSLDGYYGSDLRALAFLSDIDGDGFRELAIAHWATKNGKIYLFSGKSKAVLATISAQPTESRLGMLMISISDINGDGFRDIGDHDVDGKGDFPVSSTQVTMLFLSARAEPVSIQSRSTVVTAGCDIDGNGTDDIVLGGGILDDTTIIEVYDGKSLEKTVLLNELMAGARQRLAEDIICIKHPAGDFIIATEPEFGLRKIERLKAN